MTTATQTRSIKALKDETGIRSFWRLREKLDRLTWVGLTDGEQSLWRAYQEGILRFQARHGNPGRLVFTAYGLPMAWTAEDDAIHGRCPYLAAGPMAD